MDLAFISAYFTQKKNLANIKASEAHIWLIAHMFTFFRSLAENEIYYLPARIFQNWSVLYYMYVDN